MSITSIIVMVVIFFVLSPIIVPFLLFTPIGWLLSAIMFFGFWIWVFMKIIGFFRGGK